MSKLLSLLGISGALGMSMSPFEMRHSPNTKPTTFVHRTKKGPGRSLGVKRRQPVRPSEVSVALMRHRVVRGVPYVGVKVARKVYDGTLGLRGRTLTGASLLAQQSKLGDGWLSNKSHKARSFG